MIAMDLEAIWEMSVKVSYVVGVFVAGSLLAGCQTAGSHLTKAEQAASAKLALTVPIADEFIDVHVHLIGGRSNNEDYRGAANEAIDHMDRLGIRKAIILPPPQVINQDWYDYPAFAHALRKYPDRFSFLGGGGKLNAKLHKYSDPSSVTEDVKRTFANQAEKTIRDGAIGFGEIASLHISAVPGHPFEFVPADHPLLRVLAVIISLPEVMLPV